MSILSDQEIKQLQYDHYVFSPFSASQVQPGSYELTLATGYLLQRDPEHVTFDQDFSEQTWSRRGWVDPGDFILASTVETVSIPDFITAQVNGKSSLGRQGLVVHVTAGFVDAGFRGTLTLEIANLSKTCVLLRPGQKIAQLALFRMAQPAVFPYGSTELGSHYMNQEGPTEARG